MSVFSGELQFSSFETCSKSHGTLPHSKILKSVLNYFLRYFFRFPFIFENVLEKCRLHLDLLLITANFSAINPASDKKRISKFRYNVCIKVGMIFGYARDLQNQTG